MEKDNQNMMADGANADMLYANVASYLTLLANKMTKKHRQRSLAGKPITWAELDYVNRELQHDLDVIIAGNKNVTENTAPKYESLKRSKVRLSESDLHRMIRQCVNEALHTLEAKNVGD